VQAPASSSALSVGSDSVVGTSACFPDRLSIEPDVIHVVRICLDSPVEYGCEVLDDSERDRASRFIFERDRRRFVVAHRWVRILLGRCLARSPESLRFVAGAHGKPSLVDAPFDLRFNLSHAGERALLAITRARDVGIDIEQERDIEVLELASRFFAPSEAAALRAIESCERIPAFFRCWTRKEAFIKALGDGFAFPLDGFEVSLSDDPSLPLLRGNNDAVDLPLRWRIESLASERGYAAALAATAGDWHVRRWEASAVSA
jgi:4'-phosphopantetheinyl transferase